MHIIAPAKFILPPSSSNPLKAQIIITKPAIPAIMPNWYITTQSTTPIRTPTNAPAMPVTILTGFSASPPWFGYVLAAPAIFCDEELVWAEDCPHAALLSVLLEECHSPSWSGLFCPFKSFSICYLLLLSCKSACTGKTCQLRKLLYH